MSLRVKMPADLRRAPPSPALTRPDVLGVLLLTSDANAPASVLRTPDWSLSLSLAACLILPCMGPKKAIPPLPSGPEPTRFLPGRNLVHTFIFFQIPGAVIFTPWDWTHWLSSSLRSSASSPHPGKLFASLHQVSWGTGAPPSALRLVLHLWSLTGLLFFSSSLLLFTR